MTEITFTDEQNRAIDAMVDWYGNPDKMEFYLAGYAGVGKSTVAKEAVRRIRATHDIDQTPMGAYTGKAAHVLRKKGNANTSTIHSMIYTPQEDVMTGEVTFVKNPLGPAATAELIMLDECSMIDEPLANDLRSFNKKILVMGDPGQLPPISGTGSFTSREPDFFLKQIHRQAADSPIIELATLARQGNYLPIGYHKDNVRVLKLTNETAEEMHDSDTQVICGIHRVRHAVTQIMRNRLGYTEQVPMPGERLICRKNNKDRGLFNGGMGTLAKIEVIHDGGYRIDGRIEDVNQKKLLVDPFLFRQHFDGGASQYDWKKRRLQFDWAYAITCHSAQGSSWRHVTVIDDSDSFRESKWLWLYTAITRAEEGLTILIK